MVADAHRGKTGSCKTNKTKQNKTKELDERGESLASFTGKIEDGRRAWVSTFQRSTQSTMHLRQHVQHNDLLGASLDRPECHVPVPARHTGGGGGCSEGGRGGEGAC